MHKTEYTGLQRKTITLTVVIEILKQTRDTAIHV